MIAPNEENSEFEGYIRVENQNDPADFDNIPVYLKTPVNIHTVKMMIYQLFMKCINLFSEKITTIFQHLL